MIVGRVDNSQDTTYASRQNGGSEGLGRRDQGDLQSATAAAHNCPLAEGTNNGICNSQPLHVWQRLVHRQLKQQEQKILVRTKVASSRNTSRVCSVSLSWPTLSRYTHPTARTAASASVRHADKGHKGMLMLQRRPTSRSEQAPEGLLQITEAV